MRTECEYPSDVTNRQWQLIRQLLPPRKRRGRRPIPRRRIVNAILYVVRSGCQWRMLPKNYPNWSTVYGVFRQWRIDGTWQRVHDALREKTRKEAGKKSTPTVAVVDSQSVRTAEGGDERGYDSAKKITGRKRHLAVDTLGLLLAVVVHGADCQDQDGAKWVLSQLGDRFRRIKIVFGDIAYGRSGLPAWTAATFGWILQTVLRPVGVSGFVVLPKRWIVERTFAWLIRHRRHARDYEKLPASSEALIQIAMIGLMARRLAKAEN